MQKKYTNTFYYNRLILSSKYVFYLKVVYISVSSAKFIANRIVLFGR